MSSHHVIRENQEAAIYLVDVEAINVDVLESFFEWSPIIVTNEETFVFANEKRYKIDALVCEKGFKENFETEIALQQPIEVILSKNSEHILNDGLDYLIREKSIAINLFSKMNNLSFRKLSREFPGVTIDLINREKKTHLVMSGIFEKWFPSGTHLELLPTRKDQLFIISLSGKTHENKIINLVEKLDLFKEGNLIVQSYQDFLVIEF